MLVCLATASVGLPIALVSISKLLLLVGGAATLLFAHEAHSNRDLNLQRPFTPLAVLLALLAFTLSLLWTTASAAEAYGSVAKYGKLILIPLIVMLLRTTREACYALSTFALTQSLLVIGSWLLFMGVPIPWATSHVATSHFAVFSSYLDQGIMTAVFAGVCWHLSALVPGRFGPMAAMIMTVLALGNVLFVFEGRSGHAVAIALISLAVMWRLPRKLRASVILLPFVLLAILYLTSNRVHDRVNLVKNEVAAFSVAKGQTIAGGTSSGIRLHFWHRAVQSISQHPWIGSGVGSWSNEFNRLENEEAAPSREQKAHQKIEPQGNPHQEYLQWGVQLGVPGLLLIAALMAAILKDTLSMRKPYARAAQSALTALAIVCLFNSSLYDALIGDFFCIALGLLLALGRLTSRGVLEAHSVRPS